MDIRIKITRDGSGKIKTINLEEYLRGVISSEMPTSWPEEALKAQTVAARTYAMKNIQNRKKYEYDVDDTVSFQAYRENNTSIRTDKIIQETEGQYITFNEKIIDAVYSSSNGGRTRSAEERWGGKILYLPAQDDPYNTEERNGHSVGMSQYGAKHRAEAGHSYKEILQFYYPGTFIQGISQDENQKKKLILDIRQCLLTQNRCYKANNKMNPIGIVVHSTGANNKTLKRYLFPDDGIIGKNQYGNHWNREEATACVNGFIGIGQDNKTYIYQTLPWDIQPWGCGSGTKGSYNHDHIQFEICEDNLTDESYFKEAFNVAAQLCAYLVQKFNMKIENVVSHAEAHKAGYGSNHGDPDHWLKRFGKTMDDFRIQVQQLMGEEIAPRVSEQPIQVTSYKIRVTADALNYRSGPGIDYKINGTIKDRGIYTIIEEQNGWGKLKSGAGWISLQYTKLYNDEIKEQKIILSRLLKNTCKGNDVKELQKTLINLGYDCGVCGADGFFGKDTMAAVKKFQNDKNLEVDGIVGEKTCNAFNWQWNK